MIKRQLYNRPFTFQLMVRAWLDVELPCPYFDTQTAQSAHPDSCPPEVKPCSINTIYCRSGNFRVIKFSALLLYFCGQGYPQTFYSGIKLILRFQV